LAALLVVHATAALHAQTLKKVPRKLPRPTPDYVLEMLDALTTTTSGPRKKASLLSGSGQQELIVYKGRVQVSLEGESSNFRGAVEVKVSMAADVHFTIDLDRVELAGWDRQRRVLKVKLPPVKVGPVSRDEDSRDVRVAYRRGRFALYDGDTAREVEASLLREKFNDQAREAAADRRPDAEKQARAVVRDFLWKFLHLNGSDIVIEVGGGGR
jgi:hypothetical protein